MQAERGPEAAADSCPCAVREDLGIWRSDVERKIISDKGDEQVLGAVSAHPNPSHPQTRLCFSSSRQETTPLTRQN